MSTTPTKFTNTEQLSSKSLLWTIAEEMMDQDLTTVRYSNSWKLISVEDQARCRLCENTCFTKSSKLFMFYKRMNRFWFLLFGLLWHISYSIHKHGTHPNIWLVLQPRSSCIWGTAAAGREALGRVLKADIRVSQDERTTAWAVRICVLKYEILCRTC